MARVGHRRQLENRLHRATREETLAQFLIATLLCILRAVNMGYKINLFIFIYIAFCKSW